MSLLIADVFKQQDIPCFGAAIGMQHFMVRLVVIPVNMAMSWQQFNPFTIQIDTKVHYHLMASVASPCWSWIGGICLHKLQHPDNSQGQEIKSC